VVDDVALRRCTDVLVTLSEFLLERGAGAGVHQRIWDDGDEHHH